MKFNIEYALLLALVVVMYLNPRVLGKFSNSILGKIVLVAGVITLTHYNTMAGLLGALIIVALFQTVHEGLAQKDSAEQSDDEDEEEEKHILDTPKNMTVEGLKQKNTPMQSQEEEERAEKRVMMPLPEYREGVENKNGKKSFLKKHCKENKLVDTDGNLVSLEDIGKKYPNLSFTGDPCDPCDSECKFDISDLEGDKVSENFSFTKNDRLKMEEGLRAKDSNSNDPKTITVGKQ